MGGGGGQLVGLANDELGEAVALVERLAAGIDRHPGRRDHRGRWGNEEVHLGPPLAVLLDPEHQRHRLAQHLLCNAGQHRSMLGLIPLNGELIGRADHQAAIIVLDGFRRFEPGANRMIG